MSVPDTNNFSLQDVVDEITPVEYTLEGCFDIATDGFFDSNYGGSGYTGGGTGIDRLSNFRNYGTSLRWIKLLPYTNYESGWVEKYRSEFGTSGVQCFDICREETTGDFTDEVNHYKVMTKVDFPVVLTYQTTLRRTFMSFDLRDFTETVITGKFKVRKVSYSNNSNHGDVNIPKFGIAEWYNDVGVTLEADDFGDALNASTELWYRELMGYGTTGEEITQGDLSIAIIVHVANPTQISNWNNYETDRIAPLCLIENFDFANEMHAGWMHTYELEFWRDGTETGDYVWKPELWLQYSGAEILIPSLNPWEPIAEQLTDANIRILANESNSWSASVTTGGTWLSIISGATGTGTEYMKLRVTTNTGIPRVGYVTIESNITDKVITVSQEGIPSLYTNPDFYEAPYNDQNKQFQVVAHPDDNAWTASFVDTGFGTSWISFVGGYTGIGDGLFTINIEDTAGSVRSCEIKIVSDAADFTIDVSQNIGSISGSGLFISNLGLTDSTSITVIPTDMNTTSTKEDTGDGTTWFNITAGATGSGNFTLSIEVNGVPPLVNKSAQIRITDDGSGVEKVIAVTYMHAD